MPKRRFYVPKDFDRVWNRFVEICHREGTSASGHICNFIQDYVRVHEPGNPQLLLNSFLKEEMTIQQKTFTATIQLVKSIPSFGEVEVEKEIKVTEGKLIDLLRQWTELSEKSKRYWRKVLSQIDHPLAKDILERDQEAPEA